MEVCGGHTHAIYRFGLKDILPENIELIHGPGCPVCVLPMGRIDDGLTIAKEPDRIFAAFGDMMRVPGAHGSPLEHKARGTDVRIVYSPADALADRQKESGQGSDVLRHRIRNHRTINCADADERQSRGHPQLLRLLQSRHHRAGDPRHSRFARHASRWLHRPRTRLHRDRLPPLRVDREIEGKPVVTSGFEPLDLLQSIVMLLRQLEAGEAKVENQYKRVVPWEGNRAALKAMAEVFELRPYFEWRGLGFISQSALRIREKYAPWDAEQRYPVPETRVTDPKSAQCGEVLKGVLEARAMQVVRQGMHS